MAPYLSLEGQVDGIALRVDGTRAFRQRGSLSVDGTVVAQTKSVRSLPEISADVVTPRGKAAVRAVFSREHQTWSDAADFCKVMWNGEQVSMHIRRAPWFMTIPRWQRLLIVLLIVGASIAIVKALPALDRPGFRLVLPMTLYFIAVNIPRNFEAE